MTTDIVKPQSQRIIPPPDALVDLTNSSILDLCTRKIPDLPIFGTAVFIRPPNVGIEDMLRGGNDPKRYTFNGISVPELQQLSEKALKQYVSFYSKRYPGPVFGTFYPINDKADIYAAIEAMHSRHNG